MIPSVRFDEIYTTNTYRYFVWNTWVVSFARYRWTNDSRNNKGISPFVRKMLNFVAKIQFYIPSYIIILSNSIATNVSKLAEKVLLLLVISLTDHEGFITWKRLLQYCPFVRRVHRSRWGAVTAFLWGQRLYCEGNSQNKHPVRGITASCE